MYPEKDRPVKVEFSDQVLQVTLKDGRLIATPLEWYPSLVTATPEQRTHYELGLTGIHWPDLNEDLSVAGMLRGSRGENSASKQPPKGKTQMTKTFPSYESWFLPFLKILSDGELHQRGDIIDSLADQAEMTKEQREERYDNGTLKVVNNVAWCDVYLCKAGFVIKGNNGRDNLKDAFQVTELGLNELRESSDKISVKYLHGFWK